MRNLPHIAARLYGAPLLLLPSVAESFSHAFQQLLQGNALPPLLTAANAPGEQPEPSARPGAYSSNVAINRYADKPYAVTDAGVGLLGVYGALVQRAGQMDANCMPLASYQRLQARFDAMQADPDVKAILMEYDTPGGEAAGNFQLAAHMLAQRAGKPVWAHVNEGAYSAGYSLAAAASRVVAPQTGDVGSIGVVMLHVDQSAKDAKAGLVYTYIHAGARKVDGNPHEPLSRAAKAGAQAAVDRLYDVFTTHVAQARGMDLQAVRGTEAATYSAAEAKQLGLVDAIGTYAETLAELEALANTSRTATVGGTRFATAGGLAAQHHQGDAQMGIETSAATPQAAAPLPPATAPSAGSATAPTTLGIPQAEHEAALASTATAARAGEKARIGAIVNHAEAAGRQQLARTLAFDTDLNAEAAATILAAAAKEAAPVALQAPAGSQATSPLARAMASVPNPAVGPDHTAGAGQAATEPGSERALAANVITLFNQAKGAK
jgi:signal peptide peptidase SppA